MCELSRIIHIAFLCTVLSYATCMKYVVRKTKYGKVRGFVEKIHGGKKVEKYFGIPFAQAPIGKLRFEVPKPPTPWGEGILNAIEIPPACSQPKMGVNYINTHVPGFNKTSEDCLFLNIYVPLHNHYPRGKYPVLVFVHGGSYLSGMGAMLEGSHLSTHEIIVVTFNYRLGPLGFLSGGDSDFPGNYGLLDQIEALKWVKENIAAFGGDPGRVTIDGHSAGGCSVGLLMLTPLAKGLFQGIIQQSGSPFAEWALTRRQEGPDFHFRLFSASVRCASNDSKAVKECLQQIPSEQMEQIILEELEMPLSMAPPFRPVVDGRVLPDTPERLAIRGPVNAKFVLTGATQDEGELFGFSFVEQHSLCKHATQKLLAVMNCFRGDLPEVQGIVESVLEQYTRWPYDTKEEHIKQRFSEIVGDYFIVAPTHKAASLLSRHNLTVFVYNFEYKSVFDEWKGVVHGAELMYLSGFPLTGHQNDRYDDSDKSMTRMLLMLWGNFVKNGLPSLVPLQEFHMARFTEKQPLYTRFSSNDDVPTVTVGSHFKTKKLAFWNNKIPEMYRRQFRNSIFDDGSEKVIEHGKYVITQTSNSWILIAACIGLSILTVLLSVCYCQMRRQVNELIRQSISSGERML